ncbi:MAG: RND transporter [Bryobacteraceae bacterium]|jgi:cobalt-zinc-cadmium efflux system membrane fusion protein|nr:MAG: RND transporter [Bryobacteraceae bacterium]
MRILTMLVVCFALASCAKKEQFEAGKAGRTGDEAHDEKHIEEANVVELSMEAQKQAGIEVQQVRLGTVEVQIKATGTVQPIDSRIVHLRPLARGRVVQVLAKIGDRVERDQMLARFDNIEAGELSSQVDAARAELQRLRIQLATARRQAERARNLIDIGAVAVKEYEAAEADARALEEAVRAQQSTLAGIETRLRRFGAPTDSDASLTAIRAPFAGVVIRTEAAPGDVVDSSSILFSIADLSRVYVEAQVYEKDIGKIRINQPALITVETYPGEVFRGRVVAIKDILNPQTRTAAVRCELANPAGKLKLEMFANVAIPTADTHLALTLPSDAVQTISRRQVVFVKKADLHFEAREVQVLGDGPRIEITAGLKEGELVVVRGAFQLKSAFLAKELQSEHEHD